MIGLVVRLARVCYPKRHPPQIIYCASPPDFLRLPPTPESCMMAAMTVPAHTHATRHDPNSTRLRWDISGGGPHPRPSPRQGAGGWGVLIGLGEGVCRWRFRWFWQDGVDDELHHSLPYPLLSPLERKLGYGQKFSARNFLLDTLHLWVYVLYSLSTLYKKMSA